MSNPKALSLPLAHEIRDACFCLQVQRAARSLARRYDEALRPVQLTNGQFSLLVSLHRAEPASIGSVAALLAMDRTTLTANLKPLERRGLVKIAVDPKDRRGRMLTLTTAGRALLAAALPLWRRVQAATERLIGEAGADRLRDNLCALS